jgi:hypothetical protein
MKVLVYNNLGYLPITKNASTTFTNFFRDRGWQECQLDQIPDSVKIFGHFQDPINRHFKGVAEFLYQNSMTHLVDDPSWQKIFTHSVMDIHSMPISWALGDRVHRIKWIPIHRSINTGLLTQRWLEAQDFVCDMESVVWGNQSGDDKLCLHHHLRHLYQTQPNNGSLTYFYDYDIVIWNKLWPYVDENNVTHRIY